MPGARCTRGLVCKQCAKNAHEHTGTDGTLRHSLRNGLTAYAALSPATNSSCHRHRRIEGFAKTRSGSKNLRRLDTSNGCQDHTVLPSAASSRHTPRPARMLPEEVSTEAFKRRSSSRRLIAHGNYRPATTRAPDAAASTATCPNVRDDGQRPSWRDRIAGVVDLIWVTC